MKATTMLDTLSSMLGRPACAIPLSMCKPRRTHLLERAGISAGGTAMLFAVPYISPEDVDAPDRNVSLYAVPRDYHGYMAEVSERVLPVLRRVYPDHRFALFSDHSPIAEVDAAARAGLGVLGRNGLLITSDHGSFVFIGEVVTDADYGTVTGGAACGIPVDPPTCEGCGACLHACPSRSEGTWTSACLSELTQKKGALTAEEEKRLADHKLVWGCDTCQTVCPHNRDVLQGHAERGDPYFQIDRLVHVCSETLAGMSDEAFAGRAYAWRGRSVMMRNCLLKEEEP